jgi:hypothetical protein
MQLYEILPEEDLSIEKVKDPSSADRFLSRLDKKEAKISQPAIAEKIAELEAQIEKLEDNDPNDSRIKGMDAAIGRLKQWQKDNPIVRVANPANNLTGRRGSRSGSFSGSGNYSGQNTAF